MRAFPPTSLAYFGEIADGNTALPDGAAAGALAVLFDFAAAGVFFGDSCAEPGAVAVAFGDASGPHSARRNAFQLLPWSVPAACAALYLALHSCMVMAFAAEL